MTYVLVKTREDDPEPVRYDLPTALTIGEQREILQEFGQDAAGLGMIWIAIRRRYPQTAAADIDGVYAEVVEEEEDKLPPTFAAANGSSAESGTSTEAENTGLPGLESTTG